MAKKRKVEHNSDGIHLEVEEPADPRESLRAFVIEAKVTAFAYAYEPADSEFEADEVFTDEKLRQYFNAYPRATGDPLVLYVDEHLIPLGFRMSHSQLLNEPAIFVRRK